MTHPHINSPRIVAGKRLWEALGFKNERAFQRARKSGLLRLKLYPLADNKSVYARSDELSEFLRSRREHKGGISPMKT